MLEALKKIHYKIDVIIIMAILTVSIIGIVHLDMIFYNAGIVNEIAFKAVPYSLLYELPKIAIVLFAVIRIFFHFKPGNRKKRYAVTTLVSFLIFIGSWVFFFTLHQPRAVYYLRGFEKWVTKNVDVDAVQTWILSPEADKYLGHRYERDRIPSDFPDFIRNVNPEWIDFFASEKGRCIEFMWVNGISESKGIVVGSPAMNTQQEGLIKHSNTDFQFRHSIKPGIYVIHGR